MKTFLVLSLSLILAPLIFAQSATVFWTKTDQTMDGFGASTGFEERNPNLTEPQADCFFSVTNGSCASGTSIGMEWVKVQDNGVSNSAPDLPTLQFAVARGAKVDLGFNGPQLTSSNFSSQASYMVGKILYFQSNGVPISAVGVMNEPQNSGTTAANLDTFVASNLHPLMVSNGLGNIPLVLGESADWFITDYVTPCLNDTNCTKYVPIVAGHPYHYPGDGLMGVDGFKNGFNCCIDYAVYPPPSSASGKRIWQTEVNGGFGPSCPNDPGIAGYDGSMADALVYAHNIHDFLTVVGGSAWMYWNLQAETSHALPDCNDGITDSNFNPAHRFYAIGNWSKFVRSGWVRIDATTSPAPGIYISAFKETSSGDFAIVAVNQNASSANVDFSLSGFPSVTTVIPTLTSASVNLIDQANVAVSSGAFSYSLPASSVITFHGTASSGSTSSLNPPTGLSAFVH
jgi:glucuronoarabinoxylan endo-1,4-beta-xylanase